MTIDETQALAKNLIQTGKILKREILIGYEPENYFSSRLYPHCIYLVSRDNQLFWIHQINNTFTSIYDINAEKEVTAL